MQEGLDNIFKPTVAQSRFKAKLLSACATNPLLDVRGMSTGEMARYGGSRSVERWIKDEQFHAWLLDDEADRNMVKAGAHDAVSALLSIINEPDMGPKGKVTASAKVAAANLIMKSAGLFSEDKVVETEDTTKLTKEELEEKAKQLMEQIN